jgi:hypothetical protein
VNVKKFLTVLTVLNFPDDPKGTHGFLRNDSVVWVAGRRSQNVKKRITKDTKDSQSITKEF